jgi:hypothetical protein
MSHTGIQTETKSENSHGKAMNMMDGQSEDVHMKQQEDNDRSDRLGTMRGYTGTKMFFLFMTPHKKTQNNDNNNVYIIIEQLCSLLITVTSFNSTGVASVKNLLVQVMKGIDS